MSTVIPAIPASTVCCYGTVYKICWSTEASQQVLELYGDELKAKHRQPIGHGKIIGLLRRYPREPVSVADSDNPNLYMFAVKRDNTANAVVYEVFVSLSDGSSPDCEILGVFISADADVCALAL